ncbi:hypothetical protein DSM19430T_27670 [Desulfovibrio psychrotolerans]|uniref:Uncharacterized protein n=1 Tax=Desulfovibrio psychrotolerans TaxID=415242 RepID=A0A7J0BWK8_9BACT|nr:hypothetical protein DSM19430T_27670 [Desulfovibrio psychrotolerans]
MCLTKRRYVSGEVWVIALLRDVAICSAGRGGRRTGRCGGRFVSGSINAQNMREGNGVLRNR